MNHRVRDSHTLASQTVKLFISVWIFCLNVTTDASDHKEFYSYYKNAYSASSSRQQRVLLVSLDGFRHDYIQAYSLKNLEKFLSTSSSSIYLNPQFTTVSLPNHWSMITGSNVENHGMVAENFYDPLYRDYFNSQKTDQKWWNTMTPVWHSATEQGVKTGVFYWPGGEVPFNTRNLSSPYTLNPPFQVNKFRIKINEAVKLFLNENYKFVSLYDEQPGQIARKYGIDSPEFNVTLGQLDEDIGYLMQRLEENKLTGAQDFNVMLVSPHGMVNIKQIIFINEYLLESDVEIWSFSESLIHMRPLIDLNTLLMKLSRIPGASVTLRENLPERLHYKTNKRIGEVIVSAVEGVSFMYMDNKPFQISNNGQISYFRLTYNQKKQLMIASANRATSGYDNLYPSMRGIFIAQGSMFKSNYITNNPVENVDIYPLLCHILDIHCETRNGSIHNVKNFLKRSGHASTNSRSYRKYLLVDNSCDTLRPEFANRLVACICFLLICWYKRLV